MPARRSHCRRAARRAFTLTELLVAMAVSLILVLALVRVFSAAMTSWQRGEAQVDAYREARGALQVMARDLGGILPPSYAQFASGTKVLDPLLPTLVLERYGGGTGDGSRNEEVYCLTNIPNRIDTSAASAAASPADTAAKPVASKLCAVGYYCQWMPDSTALFGKNPPRAFALMRQFLNSRDTFTRIKAATTADTSSHLTFFELYSREPVSETAPSLTQLAAYVWDLRFRIDSNLNEQLWPDGNLPPPNDRSATPLPYSAAARSAYPPNLPPYIEIRFMALSTTAGRRLENNAAVDISTWKDRDPNDAAFKPSALYQNIIQPSARQFILRVPLNGSYTAPVTPTPSPTP